MHIPYMVYSHAYSLPVIDLVKNLMGLSTLEKICTFGFNHAVFFFYEGKLRHCNYTKSIRLEDDP